MRSTWQAYRQRVRESFSADGRASESPWSEDREWTRDERPPSQHEWALLFVVAAIMIIAPILALR